MVVRAEQKSGHRRDRSYIRNDSQPDRFHGTSLKKTCPPSLMACFAFADQVGGVFMLIA
ncbi:hypothetical protein D3C72_2272460 [compost metagenome]